MSPPSPPPELTEALGRDATCERAAFESRIVGIPYERKGILFSEMFFLWILARTVSPRRILESGRARGQSTLILSLCFPEVEIVSVEYDRDSPDVAVAAQRLQGRDNVRQLFGDATKMLPAMAQPGDLALIDGPKGYRGLRLALRLLGARLPMVFVHDACSGSQERRFLSRRMPEALYSDRAEFAASAHTLDRGVWDDLPQERRWTPAGAPEAGYGFALACLPRIGGRGYRLLRWHAVVDGLRHRLLKQ